MLTAVRSKLSHQILPRHLPIQALENQRPVISARAFPTQIQPGVRVPQVALIKVAHTSVQPVCRRNHSEQTSTKSETRLVLSLSAIIDLDPVGLTHWKVVVIGRCGAYSFFQNASDFAFLFIGGGTGRAPGHRAPL